jgi:outer membrane beta-barrel protein
MPSLTKSVAPAMVLLGLAAFTPAAHAGAEPAEEALSGVKDDKKNFNVVQNRFFLKEKRFELAPVAGYVPNNPFAVRYVGGLLVAYHFTETLAAEGAFMYSPDLGEADLKGLTNTLVGIASSENADSEVSFQQPIEKMVMGATFAARWAPVYGKINLIGERVLNFDFYGVAGLGLLTIREYFASANGTDANGTPVTGLGPATTKAKVPVNVGVGFDFFVGQSVAVKIDARNYLYIDSKPQYDPNVPEDESRLYNNFIASVGVGLFFPKMKPRQYDF